uniref:Uncharacterized protein n=1 Tax=Rhizophora mucronata TaxID=61149 RepID=A0A2P2N4T7_RHIMU
MFLYHEPEIMCSTLHWSLTNLAKGCNGRKLTGILYILESSFILDVLYLL